MEFLKCLTILLFLWLGRKADGACTLPVELQGSTWIDSEFIGGVSGATTTLTVGTDEIYGIFVSAAGIDMDTFRCVGEQNGVYLLESTDSFFDSATFGSRRIYLCMRITKVTDDLFYYHLLSDISSMVLPNIRATSALSTPTDVCATCTATSPPGDDDYHLLERQGTTDTTDFVPSVCYPCDIICTTADPDDCATQPCLNGATCIDGVSSFTCTCDLGFTGQTCEIDIDDCLPDPCQNDGTCTDGVNSYTCACVLGFTGTDCETDVNNCSPNPCKHGGTCTDGINSYTCECPKHYRGSNCQTWHACSSGMKVGHWRNKNTRH